VEPGAVAPHLDVVDHIPPRWLLAFIALARQSLACQCTENGRFIRATLSPVIEAAPADLHDPRQRSHGVGSLLRLDELRTQLDSLVANSTHKCNGWVDSEKYLISIAPTLCVGAQSCGALSCNGQLRTRSVLRMRSHAGAWERSPPIAPTQSVNFG